MQCPSHLPLPLSATASGPDSFSGGSPALPAGTSPRSLPWRSLKSATTTPNAGSACLTPTEEPAGHLPIPSTTGQEARQASTPVKRRPDWSTLYAPTHSDLWLLDCSAVTLPTARRGAARSGGRPLITARPRRRNTPPPYASSFALAVRRDSRARSAARAIACYQRLCRLCRKCCQGFRGVGVFSVSVFSFQRLCGLLSWLLLAGACAGLIAAAGWGALQFSETQSAAVCFLLAAGSLLAGVIRFNHKEHRDHKKSTGPDNQ